MVEKRLTKRQIREDILLTWTARIEAFAEENWRRLLIGVGAVVILVLVSFYVRNARYKAELDASELLAQAQAQQWAGNQVESAQIAGQVMERSPGTRSARIAQLMRGDALLKTGDLDGSIAAYRAFLDQEKRDDVLRLSARRGLVVALEDAGQFAAAAELYEELGREELEQEKKRDDKPGPLPAHDLLAAGRCWEHAGDVARARALYEELVGIYPKDAIASDAKLRLAELAARSPASTP